MRLTEHIMKLTKRDEATLVQEARAKLKLEFPPGTLVRYKGDFTPAVGVVRYTNIHHSKYISVYVFWFDTGNTIGYGLEQLEKVEP